MAQDPRNFMAVPCVGKDINKNVQRLGNAQNARRGFFNALGKVGDLQILNSTQATSKVGQGLRTLSSSSNSIRTGQNGGLPSAIGDNLDAGANYVLGQMGVSEGQMQALTAFNPTIANNAYGNAKQIYQRVKQGGFSLTDIPSYLQEFQDLERMVRGIFYPNKQTGSQLRQVCDPSPYAMDLVRMAPKFKFLFVVEFLYNGDYAQLGNLDFAFVIKRSTRPVVNYQYEDVNYYNFRTKVPTKTDFQQMQMTFHDDNKNQALRFYNAYLRSMSPITNLNTGQEEWDQRGMSFEDAAFDTAGPTSAPFADDEGNVMAGVTTSAAQDPNNIEFTIPANQYSGSIGPLRGNNTRSVMREARVYQVFDYGQKINIYRFFNPRIEQLQLDEMSMEDSTGSEVTVTFNYDNIFIATDIPFVNDEANLESITGRSGVYPLHNNGFGTKTTNNPYRSPVPGITGATGAGGQIGGLIGNAQQKLSQLGSDIVDNVKGAFATTPPLSPLGQDIEVG